jgi:hypothetical protein
VKNRNMSRIRPEYDIAIEFLRSKAHRVSEYSPATNECAVDGLFVSDLGLIILAQDYGYEWLYFLQKIRYAEQSDLTTSCEMCNELAASAIHVVIKGKTKVVCSCDCLDAAIAAAETDGRRAILQHGYAVS